MFKGLPLRKGNSDSDNRNNSNGRRKINFHHYRYNPKKSIKNSKEYQITRIWTENGEAGNRQAGSWPANSRITTNTLNSLSNERKKKKSDSPEMHYPTHWSTLIMDTRGSMTFR